MMPRPSSSGSARRSAPNLGFWQRLRWRWVGQAPWSGPGYPLAPTGESQAPQDASFVYPGGDAAVMLIHGLTGTPTEMRTIAKLIAKGGFTVYGIQLAGHCGSEEDLLQTDWQDWYASVEAAFEKISKAHKVVYVGGLSMGAVLAIHLAAQHPQQVQGLALYSATLEFDGWAVPWLSFLFPWFMNTSICEHYRFVETFPYGIKDERLRTRILNKMMRGDSAAAGTLGMTGRSLRELRRLVKIVKGEMAAVRTPALIVQAVDDDITSPRRNGDYLRRHLAGPVSVLSLDDSYHIVTIDRQHSLVAAETTRFFKFWLEQSSESVLSTPRIAGVKRT
jgi:carboxylesterase